MRFLFLMLICFQFLSCSKESEIIRESLGRLIIDPQPLGVSDYYESLWKVGKDRDIEISKGIYILVDIPQFDSSDLESIYKDKKADSWVLFINKDSQVIKTFYFKFANRSPNGKYIFTQNKQVGLKILYPAAYISTEYENLNCPILGHNKKINKIVKYDLSVVSRNLVLGSFNQKRIYNELHKIHFSINKVNGGKSLVGDYTFELALFNSSEKKLMSNILKVPTGLRVDYEKSLELTGCPKGPRNLEQIDQKQKKLRNFKFGS